MISALAFAIVTRTATVYDQDLDGRKTASGQVYRHWGVSAASNDWKLGTKATVSFQGRSVTVTINDRMARRFTGKRIDLSGGAMRVLQPGYRGDKTPLKMEVSVEILK